MPLVEYSSGSSSSEDDEPVSKKQKVTQDLPPLPAAFRDLYATAVRTSNVDDPSLHGGKRRVTPHIEGNWPSHVYTGWIPSIVEQQCIKQLIETSCQSDNTVHDFLTSELGAPTPLHISLSRSLGLQTNQREIFATRLKTSVERADVTTFYIQAIGLKWVPNFTKTRWFLVLQLERPNGDQMNKLLKASNDVAATLGFLGLYAQKSSVEPNILDSEAPFSPEELDTEEFSLDLIEPGGQEQTKLDPFHVSIAWSLTKPATCQFLATPTIEKIKKLLQQLEVPVESVKAKIGNSILTIPLKASRRS